MAANGLLRYLWCWENCVTVLDYPSLSEYLINLDAVFTTYAGCT